MSANFDFQDQLGSFTPDEIDFALLHTVASICGVPSIIDTSVASQLREQGKDIDPHKLNDFRKGLHGLGADWEPTGTGLDRSELIEVAQRLCEESYLEETVCSFVDDESPGEAFLRFLSPEAE